MGWIVHLNPLHPLGDLRFKQTESHGRRDRLHRTEHKQGFLSHQKIKG